MRQALPYKCVRAHTPAWRDLTTVENILPTARRLFRGRVRRNIHQLAQRQRQSLRYGGEHIQRCGLGARFHALDGGPAQVGLVGQGLLAKTFCLAQRAQMHTKSLNESRVFHEPEGPPPAADLTYRIRYNSAWATYICGYYFHLKTVLILRISSFAARFLTVSWFSFYLLAGCQPLSKQRLTGTYQWQGQDEFFHLREVRLTETKCIMNLPMLGETAQDYTVENGTIYVGGADGQICFTIDGPGIISNQGTLGMEGTYVRAN